jgi:peroxiredoxin
LQNDLGSLKEKNVRVAAISYDSVEVLAKFTEQRKITFPLLSDQGSAAIKAFELLNKEANPRIQGVPYPGTMILDKNNVIRAKLFFDGYRERHAAADILDAVAKLK